MPSKVAREIDRIRKRGRTYIKALQRDLTATRKQVAEFIGPASPAQTARIQSLQSQIETLSNMVENTLRRNVKQENIRLDTAHKLESMMGPTRRQNAAQRATRLTGFEINAASRGEENALNATENEVKAFYRATQNLWRTDNMGGKGGAAANINEMIVRATGKPLIEVWNEVMNHPDVKEALEAAEWDAQTTTDPRYRNAPDERPKGGSPDWLMDIGDIYTSAGVMYAY